jgi:isopentenyl diphosphate isomerase/L-lactate dehydrogenase-like FMN-dependent dehydrogenase
VLQSDQGFVGNFKNTDLRKGLSDPAMTWEMIPWMKANTKMKIVIKGIVTREDAKLCVEHGADALIVSNHGGRQEESNRGTLDCLSEVVEGAEGKIPVLIDGGFRRGTDIFKALAMGAKAICIGRPYIWGLGAFGQPGVEKVLELLQAELVRIMRLAGTPSITSITPNFVISNRG